MTPELIKMKELMLKTYLDEHGCEYFNLSTDLDQYATAYLDEAIRKCVPEHEYCTYCKEDGFRCSCIGANERFVNELLSNIERFKRGNFNGLE